MTEECITPLRRRMIDDMSVRHFASKTQHDYIRTVMKLALAAKSATWTSLMRMRG
jgi:integrase/recombinase XerD